MAGFHILIADIKVFKKHQEGDVRIQGSKVDGLNFDAIILWVVYS